MARKLPWKTDAKSKESHTPVLTARSTSRPGALTSTNSPAPSTPTRTPRRPARTPSTSPPCEAPPEEFMREGLENDDKYIMVEDEFLATAQTFTRHLHHAEYVRRKNEAKIKNANSMQTLAQPTGAGMGLSAETRKNMESEENATRQKAALDEMKRSAGRPPVDSEAEDDGLESEEDREDDPWVGTSLHNLMTSQRKHQSLVGLQGIKSTTRAALGFQKAVTDPRVKTEQLDDNPPVPTRESRLNSHVIDDDTTSEDDDDLDAQPKRSKSVQIPKQQPRPTVERSTTYNPASKRTPAERPEGHRLDPQRKTDTSHSLDEPLLNISRKTTDRPTYKTKMMRLLDEFDEPAPKIQKREDQDSHRKLSRSDSVSKKRPKTEENSNKSRLNEVPIFLG
ncbi:hypothetical protein FQN53_007712 [Emmonsiellopsis sp. PD_33]|nr:hypothetical protein FQN53_007712 [Emmonsiellopsis sp. PD_33]